VFKHPPSFFIATPKCCMCNYVNYHLCGNYSFPTPHNPHHPLLSLSIHLHWHCTFFHYWYHCLWTMDIWHKYGRKKYLCCNLTLIKSSWFAPKKVDTVNNQKDFLIFNSMSMKYDVFKHIEKGSFSNDVSFQNRIEYCFQIFIIDICNITPWTFYGRHGSQFDNGKPILFH
jgi:hypothetical protein